MDNYAIADQFSLLSKLMDIHGDNAFKSKSYASAAFTIEKMATVLSTIPLQQLSKIPGIGESVGKKIQEILQTGELKQLQELLAKTPEGILEMLQIKGLGPKKIFTIWKDLHIETVAELLDYCETNKLASVKGFGEKTQDKIVAAINFYKQNEGSFLYAQVESFAELFTEKLKTEFKKETTQLTGAFRRQLEIIEKLEWVTTIPFDALELFLTAQGLTILIKNNDFISFATTANITLEFYVTTKENFYITLIKTSSSSEFFTTLSDLDEWKKVKKFNSEEEIFQQAGLSFIPPFLRENKSIIGKALHKNIPTVIEPADVKGLIHSHSNWSDGGNTIEEMVVALIKLGFEYLVISDHSKAAFYAGGLSVEKIKEQHLYIDMLNKKYQPFKIYKSIECDILSDGSLDYSEDVLALFDLVITSIHSNLQMTEEKAMERLLGAINNPYTTILGHMTGRRLLTRDSYPVDHKKIIDACAEKKVVIEINANPARLDMQWQWIEYAIEKKVLLSINPDAHTIDEFANIKYGVLVAQKGGLTKKNNLSSFNRNQFEAFLEDRKKSKQS